MWKRACDVTTALAIATTYRPHVLLLDVSMPNKGGCHLASLLRKQPCFQDALLIAVTGYAGQSYRDMCKEAGFDYFFLKPLRPTIVERLLFMAQEKLTKASTSPGNLSVQGDAHAFRLEMRDMVSQCEGASCFQTSS